jgi:coproporphyrinogen III oxidase
MVDIAVAHKTKAERWFRQIRDSICGHFEALEDEFQNSEKPAGRFERKKWERSEGGGGEISLMRGRFFEKVGVNISTVEGFFSEEFRKEIPGALDAPHFWASGISLVAHLCSPKVPAVHMNTRMIVLGVDAQTPVKHWFGGGADLNPMVEEPEDTKDFHAAFAAVCEDYEIGSYQKFKEWCDKYFWIKHRNEARGVGGIFYDYLASENWEREFAFTQAVGKTFADIYPKIARRRMSEVWNEADRQQQLI